VEDKFGGKTSGMAALSKIRALNSELGTKTSARKLGTRSQLGMDTESAVLLSDLRDHPAGHRAPSLNAELVVLSRNFHLQGLH